MKDKLRRFHFFMKKFICMALILLIALFSVVPAYAETSNLVESQNPNGVIKPLFMNISFLDAGLSINSSGLANCSGVVNLYNNNYSVVLTVQLQKYNSGSWSTIKIWTSSGKGIAGTIIDQYYYVAGGTYRVCSTAQVYNTSGYLIERESVYSATRTY
jgi:hypothetical protein